MSSQKPTLGRNVRYKVTAEDAHKINRRRTTGESIIDRIKRGIWPTGAQAHIGNHVLSGDIFSAEVVAVDEHTDTVNLQVKLDGTDILWATNVKEGTDQGEWSWPPRIGSNVP